MLTKYAINADQYLEASLTVTAAAAKTTYAHNEKQDVGARDPRDVAERTTQKADASGDIWS